MKPIKHCLPAKKQQNQEPQQVTLMQFETQEVDFITRKQSPIFS